MERPHPIRRLLSRFPAGSARTWARRVLIALGVILLLPLLAYALFLIPAVQQMSAEQVASWASRRSGTTVEIERIRLRMVRKFYFGGVFVADYNGDTLLQAKELVVRIDRFQPFNRRVDIRSVRARESQFVMRREYGDSSFSFDYFIDSLSGGGSGGDKKEKSSSPAKPWKLGLGGIEFSASTFRYLDDHNRTYLRVDMPYFGIAMRHTDPVTKFLHARSVEAEGLRVSMDIPDTLKGPRFKVIPEIPSIDPGGWIIRSDELRFSNSGFRLDNASREARPGLDFSHLQLENLNIAMRDVQYAGDTIQARIDHLSAVDHNGAELSNLEADARFTNQALQVTGMILETPGSVLTDTFNMVYGTLRAFRDFEQDVRLDARLKNSRLALADLRWFTPSLDAVAGDLMIDGNIRGPIANLRGRDLSISFGKDSRLTGRFDINGLPDVETAFIEFRLNELRSRDADLQALLPNVKFPPRLSELGLFRASGEFTGFPLDFVAYGDLKTQIGDVRSDVNMKFEPEQIRYSGNIALEAFDLGRWTGQPEWLGLTTVRSSVEGTGSAVGLGIGNLSAKLVAEGSSVTLRRYPYENLTFDGTLTEGFVEGTFVSRDANFDQTFDGTIDLRGAMPVFDFRSDLRFMDLQALGFSDDPFRMIAGISLNMVGDHIDSLLGSASIRDLIIQDSSRIYTLDSVRLDAIEQDASRRLSLDAPGISAAFEGNFELSRMPDAIRQLIYTYFPGAGIQAREPFRDQDLTFAISIRNSRGFQRLLVPQLGDFKDVYATGSFSSARNAFDVRASLPDPRYGEIQWSNWRIDVQTEAESIALFSSLDRLQLSDSLAVPATELRADYAGDSLLFRLLVGNDTDQDRLNLAGVVTAANEAFRFRILPSEIVTAGQRWQVDPNNTIAYGQKRVTAQDFVLHNGEQRIALSSLDKNGYSSWLELGMEKVQIGELLTAFGVNPLRLAGELNGRVSASNILQEAGFAGSLRIDGMAIDGLPFGSTAISASLQRPENQLNYTLALTGENQMRARGHVDFDGRHPGLEADANIDRLDIAPFGRYLDGLLEDVAGYLSGNATLRGSTQKPTFSGDLRIQDGALRMVYLNTRYQIPDVAISLANKQLTIEPTTIMDDFGNTAQLTGSMAYTSLEAWRFNNLQVRTENLLFMDTDKESNPEFYGIAYGAGTVTVDGPTNDLAVVVSASSNRGTSFTVPITYGPSVGGTDFITFFDPNAEKNKTENETETRRRLSRVRFDLFLDINENAAVALDLLGDRVQVRGRGNLQINLSTLGDFAMTGVYEVNSGDYTFSFQDVINKDFTITPGSRITFSGDPYEAQLDVNAVYKVRATEWDLLSNALTELTPNEIDRAKTPRDFEVWLELTGSLSSPEIDFDIRQTDGNTSAAFERRLFEVKADENELNKQVFGLLVMNRFIPDESGITPLLSSASSSVSEFLSKQLSVYLSDWLSSFLLEDVNVDISYRNYQTVLDPLTQQELQVALSTQIFDDRISVNLGGNFDLNQQAGVRDVTDPSNGVAGDFEISYNITADGRIRLKAFQRTDYDLYLGRNVGETGVGIFYTQEFDNLFDLVADRRRRRAIREAERQKSKESGNTSEEPAAGESVLPKPD